MESDGYVGNVFVVSRLGQLRNVQSFIKQFNAKENVLIIQYSEADGAIYRNMIEICDTNLYTEVIYLKLPKQPLRVTKKKNISMYNSINDVLNYINNKYPFNNLFLCNADKWYSYYEKVKREENLSYNINLLEEGLTTYIVSADPDYQTDPIIPINRQDLKKSCKEVIDCLKQLVHVTKNLIVKSIVLFLNIISIIFRTNLTKRVKDFVLNKTLEEKYKFSYITHFNEAFVCFPDKLVQNNFTIDKIKKLNFEFNEISKNKEIKKLDNDYCLFINQKYINYDKHFNIIFGILNEMGHKNVYIKLHPKENKTLIRKKLDEYLKDFPDLNVKIITNMDSVPVEDLIYSHKFKQIIGIISSALLYCDEFIKDTNVVSIADEYRKRCLNPENGVNRREMKLFEKEYRNFVKVSKVRQYGGGREKISN